jgi:choline dehydrogenase-like flavoprotein
MQYAPVINPNYYTHRAGRAVAIESFRYVRTILNYPALQAYTIGHFGGEVSPGPALADDDEVGIFAYVRQNTITNWYASGTAQMLPLEDGGAVDARLRVYGINGLRVVDCSVVPVLPDVNIVGPVFMVGEKGSDLIREDWGDL